MKILRQKNKAKIISIALVCVVILVGSLAAAAYYFKLGPFSRDQQSLQTEKENKAGSDIKKQSVDNNSKGTQVGSDPSPAPKPISGTTKSSVGADITSTNQDESSLHIRMLIQTVTSSGTCALTMSGPQQKTYSTSVGVQALPSTSTCKGFDIPTHLLMAGDWKISITFTSDSLTASATKNVTIR